MRASAFKVFYILIFCTCVGLFGMKLVASIWIPAWDPPFYTITAVLGVVAIGRLALKAIRLEIGEFHLRRQLIILPPLHYQVKKSLTVRRIALHLVKYATLCALLSGGVWYAHRFDLLPFQAQAARVCVSQPTPMPKIANDVPALYTWQHRGSATFAYHPTDGVLGSPSLTISNTAGTAAWTYTP